MFRVRQRDVLGLILSPGTRVNQSSAYVRVATRSDRPRYPVVHTRSGRGPGWTWSGVGTRQPTPTLGLRRPVDPPRRVTSSRSGVDVGRLTVHRPHVTSRKPTLPETGDERRELFVSNSVVGLCRPRVIHEQFPSPLPRLWT